MRFDAHDERRTHFDVREAGALFLGDGWTLFAGVGKVFWGKTEAHHLVDIVNQTDAVEDIDGEDKLGQPMVNATLEMERGAIDVFVLPCLLGELMLDGRGADAPPTPFDQDVFVGARLALNDTADTSVVGGPIVDYESSEVIAFVEFQRRFGDRWVTEVEGRWLLNTDPATPLHGLRRDDSLTLRLSRYF